MWFLVVYCIGVLVLVSLSEIALHNTRGLRDPWGPLVLVWWLGFPLVWFFYKVGSMVV